MSASQSLLKSLISLLSVLIVLPPALTGQERFGRFDAPLYLSMIELDARWQEESFPVPPNTLRTFSDSVLARERTVGFSLRLADPDSSGWSMRMDFDADRLSALRLVRVIARKPVPEGDTMAVDRLENWLTRLVGKHLSRRRDGIEGKQQWRSWDWTPRPGYVLEIRAAPVAGTRNALLTFRLDRV